MEPTTTVDFGGFVTTDPAISYSTADVEHSVFYGSEYHPVGFNVTTVQVGLTSVVSVGGSFYLVDEVTPGPWVPLAPTAGLLRLGDA